MPYTLDNSIASNSLHIMDLKLCEVRIQNEARFPWIILVPKRDSIYELIELSETERSVLMQEITLVSHAVKIVFNPDKLNIGTLGNIVKQLHIHVIARYQTDLAWPNPVWGFFEQTTRYAEDVLERRILNIKRHLSDSHITP